MDSCSEFKTILIEILCSEIIRVYDNVDATIVG